MSRIYALLSVKFPGLKMCGCKKMTNIRYDDDLCDIQASIASWKTMRMIMKMSMMIFCNIQASIASFPEERGEGRRHSKRSARMDEQANNDE